MRGHLLGLFLAFLAVSNPGAAAAGTTPGPQAGIGVQLLDVPVSRADDPRARTYIIDHLHPGTIIHRRILVSNTTPAPANVSVYEAAAHLTDGAFTGDPARSADELTSWTSFDQTALSLAANTAQAVTVTIMVPSDAADGERYGVAWAEVRSTPVSGGVTAVNRVGIRIYLSVGTGAEPVSAMSIDSLTAARNGNGQPVLSAHVHNTGQRALDIDGELSLAAGPGGLNAGPFPVKVPTTLGPGATGTVTDTLDASLPAGPWKVHLELSSGLVHASADATITFPSTPGPGSLTAPVQASQGPDLLWPVALGCVVIAASVLASKSRSRTGDP